MFAVYTFHKAWQEKERRKGYLAGVDQTTFVCAKVQDSKRTGSNK